MNTPWENSGDILQGIMATRIPPSHTPVENPPDNLMTPSDLTLGDPASFLGFQFASSSSSSSAPPSDSTVLPHRPTSLLSPWWPHSSSPPSRDYAHYHFPRRAHDQDAWNPLQVTGVPVLPSRITTYPTDGLARRCSTGQRSDFSENGSHLNGVHPSDSGYSSQSCTSRSVKSYAIDSACSPYLGPAEPEPEEPTPVLDLNVVPPGDAPLIRMNHFGSPSVFCQDTIRCDYPGCTWTGKCPSDKRKHEARHKKSFKCDEPNCARKEGFGTINDLARHKKCVHKQEPERGPKILYLCFGEDCPRRNKRWPRLDNFRQHLARMHHEEDADALLKKALDWYETRVKPQELAQSLAGRFGEDASTAPSAQLGPVGQPGDSDPDSGGPSPEQPGIRPPVEETPESTGESTPTQPPLADLEPMELPALNALHLDTMSDRKGSISSQGSGVRTEKMDDMISEAATNMINAMTKIINNGHRRRSHQPDGDTDQDSSLSDPKREMLQRILTVALDRLSGGADSRRPSAVDSGKKEWIQCEFCTKRTRLRCEMKKHKKRHERPYGCTFPNCSKTFGSKADWKRHENSQHYHLETWRCPLPGGGAHGHTAPCARVFHRQEIYAQHLRKHHGCVDDTAVQTAIARDRMGPGGGGQHAHQFQTQFWCGFCRDVVPLQSEGGLGAWNERFNHIDREHFRRGERIEDWRPSRGERGQNGVHDEGSLEEGSPEDEDDDEEEDDDSDSDSDGMHDDDIMIDDEEEEEGPSMAPPSSLKRKRGRASPVGVCLNGEGTGEGMGSEKRAKMAGGFDYMRTSGSGFPSHFVYQ